MSGTTPTPELVALLELSERATAGPWEDNPRGSDYETGSVFAPTQASGQRRLVASVSMGAEQKANAQFIAALVNWFRSTRAAALPQGVLESWFPAADAEEYLPLIAAWIPQHPLQQLTQDDYRVVRLIEGKWWSNDGLCDTPPDYVRKLDPPPAGRKSHISYHNAAMTPPPAELGEV